MKHLKYLAALPLLVALIACEAVVNAPLADEPETWRPDVAAAEQANRSRAVAQGVTVTKQDEQRDRVVVTGPWAEGWYISRRMVRRAEQPQAAAESADRHQAQPDRALRPGREMAAGTWFRGGGAAAGEAADGGRL